MSFSQALLGQDLWCISKGKEEPVSPTRVALHYQRAQSLCRQRGLSIHDIGNLTEKFWDFHFDFIGARDPTAFIIASIHLNLCVGTLANFLKHRPDLSDLVQKLVNFDVCGEFMLTEIGHGLDARNLETTATLQPDGSFDLHTPNEAAAKAMPPTTPDAGIPRVAIVFARLMVHGEDYGINPFLVWLCDANQMCRGIKSRALPMRPGTTSKPLDHAITTFEHVRLSPKALLGSMTKPKDERDDFLRHIGRVAVGTLSLSLMGVVLLQVATHIVARYSQRRTVASPLGRGRVPILSFSTQQRPILDAWAYGTVLQPYARWTVREFMNPRHSPPVRHALATTFKAVITRASRAITDLAERCGWQGLFGYNQISELTLSFQGNFIAEGDTLVLCIRLASELLASRYALPAALDPAAPLARREQAAFGAARDKIAELGGYARHRGAEFDKHLLPRCRPLVEAVGHRMAYDAATQAGAGACPPTALRLFELLCLGGAEPGWALSGGKGGVRTYEDALVEAYDEALPDMLQAVEDGEARMEGYVTAPIVADEKWAEFVEGLPAFEFPVDGKGGYQPKL